MGKAMSDHHPPPLAAESDLPLLRAYLTSASEEAEAAFTELVRRHAGWVRGVIRRTLPDAALAEEETQEVFTLLARKAPDFRADGQLIAWLHRTAGHRARRAAAKELTRHRHMTTFRHHPASLEESEPAWQAALPVLDEEIDRLPREDRELVLRRFYQKQSYREIGVADGRSEDAVRKQLARLLERLQARLRRRGVVIATGVLAGGFAKQTFAAPGDTQIARLATHALRTAAETAAPWWTTSTGSWACAAGVAVLAAALPFGWHWHATAALIPDKARSAVANAPAAAVAPPDGPRRPPPPGTFAQSTTASDDSPALLARDILALLPATNAPDVVQALKTRIARLEGAALADLVGRLHVLPNTSDLQEIDSAIWRRWGETDPAAALACRRSLIFGRAVGEHHPTIAKIWARRDYEAVKTCLAGLPDEKAAASLALEVIGRRLHTNDEDIYQTVLRIPPEQFYQEAARWPRPSVLSSYATMLAASVRASKSEAPMVERVMAVQDDDFRCTFLRHLAGSITVVHAAEGDLMHVGGNLPSLVDAWRTTRPDLEAIGQRALDEICGGARLVRELPSFINVPQGSP